MIYQCIVFVFSYWKKHSRIVQPCLLLKPSGGVLPNRQILVKIIGVEVIKKKYSITGVVYCVNPSAIDSLYHFAEFCFALYCVKYIPVVRQ